VAQIRTAHVAGSFYPDDPEILTQTIKKHLHDADETRTKSANTPAPKALIAPHAGYVYSGLTAAHAYTHLLPLRHKIKRVVILGPCHRVPVGGLALSGADYFETPLGRIAIDQELTQRISKMPQVFTFAETHLEEHSLEVHLPFLQTVLSDFTILPIVVGQASVREVADVLDLVWGGDETLIIISTDLSHYLDYKSCQGLDEKTSTAIEEMNINAIGNSQACGRVPLKGLLDLAMARGMDIQRLDVRNSGDTAGPKDRVVGYGSWMLSGGVPLSAHDIFARQTRGLIERHGKTLLQIAAASIKRGVKQRENITLDLESFPQNLKKDGACFVTIETKDGHLRGCIGSLAPHQPLVSDISQNAFKAAFNDPRFKPVSLNELRDLSLHISILSPAFAMKFKDEADLLNQLRKGKDGLIIQDQGKRALFLPSVWEKISDKRQFLAHLKLKAGLAQNHWSSSFNAWRFITEGIHSKSLDASHNLWQEPHHK
jgi:AmmeMemoRadiSam system protein B/AmmeMemoRadiSam system protein A